MSVASKELVGHERAPLSDILYRAQHYFLEQICDGLDKGIHDFKCLKARQLGISTIALAMDVFWLSVHPKIQGALVTDTDSNRDKFRILIEQFIDSLPKGLRVGIKSHNRNILRMDNDSCLDYLVAGTSRRNVSLGQSRALNFLHATEIGSWAADEGIASLRASLAQKHPNRLYIWESTAHGYNVWHDMYQEALEDPMSQKAFFIGWHMKEDYSFDMSSREYRHYWDGRLDDEEIRLCQEVEKRYGVVISPGQIAWHRWYRTTQLTNSDLMNQNFPWTDEQAFILSGNSFFPLQRVSENIKFITKAKTPFRGYRYHMGQDFLATEIEQVQKAKDAELKIWEEPVPHGVYAMGVDPSWGRSEDQKGDNNAIQVLRCYSDRVVQVAEYANHNPESYQMTWVMAHLAGAYRNCCINVEVQGPGKAIMIELKHLRQLLDHGHLNARAASMGMQEIFDCVRWYLYHRPDSMAGNYVYNFQTTLDTKLTMLNQFRDNYALNILELRSIPLLREMEKMVQSGSNIGGEAHNRDDRVFAMGLANKAYIDRLRGGLIAEGQTYEAVCKEERARAESPAVGMMSHIVGNFFHRKEEERKDEEVRQAWEDAGVVS